MKASKAKPMINTSTGNPSLDEILNQPIKRGQMHLMGALTPRCRTTLGIDTETMFTERARENLRILVEHQCVSEERAAQLLETFTVSMRHSECVVHIDSVPGGSNAKS